MSRQVKDNQIELVFEGGKAIIPPLIHDRTMVRNLINAMPAEVRDDGVPRSVRATAADGSHPRPREELMALLNSPVGPRSPGE